MRLIDADALSVEVDKSKYHNPHSQGLVSVNHRNEHDHFIKMIYDAPTVDAVEVVRCKDCKWYKESKKFTQTKFCFRLMHPTKEGRIGYNSSDNDFCSHGERKVNG